MKKDLYDETDVWDESARDKLMESIDSMYLPASGGPKWSYGPKRLGRYINYLQKISSAS